MFLKFLTSNLFDKHAIFPLVLYMDGPTTISFSIFYIVVHRSLLSLGYINSIFGSPLLLSSSSFEFTLISTIKSCLFSLTLSNTHFFMLICIFSHQHVGAVKPCNDFNRQILSKWTKSYQTFIRSIQPGYRINRFHEH